MHSSQRNIVLVGFMATGKTTVGTRVAKRLGMTFVDMDHVIEQRQGRAVSRIFAEDGEPAFRAMERELVKELSAQQGWVIATGGGIVMNPDNVRDFSRTGVVVCLSASTEALLRRVAGDTTRPLLAGEDRRAKIEALLAKRRPLYAAIPLQVDTSSAGIEEVVERVLALACGGA